jgi:hypothetical protein
MAESSKRASMLRNKQMVMVAAVGAGVLLVSLAAAYFTNSATKPSVLSVEKPATKSLALGASSTDK